MSIAVGKNAESAAALYLQKLGYKIIDRNWRRPYAEIDIIAIKNACLYFVEVKYRKTSVSGDGFSYITKKKCQQMQRAAQWWLQENRHTGFDMCLSAIAVEGDDYSVVDFIEELD